MRILQKYWRPCCDGLPFSRCRSLLSGPPSISVNTCRRRWYAAAYTMSGFDGSSATSTTPVFSLTVSTAFQFFPPSVLLYSPRSPPAPQSGPSAATYTTFESRGSTTTRPTCSDFYNPDWAIVREEPGGQNKVYLVRETKGTKEWFKIPEIQRKKIQCGKAHFKAVGLKDGGYDWVASAGDV